MTKIIIKYANGTQEFFITESEDDEYIFQLLHEIKAFRPYIKSYEVIKEKSKVKKK